MRPPGRPASRRQRLAVVSTGVLASLLLVGACGAAPSSQVRYVPALSWYVGPDRLDAAVLAETCTEQSGREYTIEVEQLPTDVTERHDELVRRMLAKDDSIDILSLDSAFTTELAGAGFLAPVPDDQVAAFSEGIAPTALTAATYDGRLAAVPWFLDPQVLWYRGNTAERAGLDTTKPISWDDLIAGAQRLGVTIQVEDRDGSGLAEWVSALTAGAGGALVSGTGRSAKAGLDTDAGREAASIVELYHDSGVGPGPSSDALEAFARSDGGFLIASTSAVADPALSTIQADLAAAPYPVVGNASVAPLAGVALAVPASAPDQAASFAAIACLTSPPVLQQLMAGPQHSASRIGTYDDATVKKAFRTLAVGRAAVTTGATVPATPYWSLVVDAIDETWLPVDEVSQDGTPEASQAEVQAVLEGRLR
ncbi:MAG: extracellular solute-binding protein [Aeromicrobium sp.]